MASSIQFLTSHQRYVPNSAASFTCTQTSYLTSSSLIWSDMNFSGPIRKEDSRSSTNTAIARSEVHFESNVLQHRTHSNMRRDYAILASATRDQDAERRRNMMLTAVTTWSADAYLPSTRKRYTYHGHQSTASDVEPRLRL